MLYIHTNTVHILDVSHQNLTEHVEIESKHPHQPMVTPSLRPWRPLQAPNTQGSQRPPSGRHLPAARLGLNWIPPTLGDAVASTLLAVE